MVVLNSWDSNLHDRRRVSREGIITRASYPIRHCRWSHLLPCLATWPIRVLSFRFDYLTVGSVMSIGVLIFGLALAPSATTNTEPLATGHVYAPYFSNVILGIIRPLVPEASLRPMSACRPTTPSCPVQGSMVLVGFYPRGYLSFSVSIRLFLALT